MNTITSIFEQAQLAEAAYADFNDPLKSDLQVLQDNGFSLSQAAEFVQNWRVVHQYDNSTLSGVFGTGFSATVFERLDAGQPLGEFSLSIRGSQDIGDFVSDMNLIVSDGVSVSQTVDLFNYWQYLTNSGEYQAANAPHQHIVDFIS